MNKKRFLFLGIALVLLALVATVAFAVTVKDGVYCAVIEGRSSRLGRDQPDHYKYYMELYNSNDYAVRVIIGNAGWNSQHDRYLGAGATNHYPCIKDSYISRVEKR
jgi:hypothetical protein